MALLLVPSASLANFQAQDWELTLVGSGSSDEDFDANAISANVGLGYFFTDQLEVAFRQGFSFADIGDESSWAASSRIAADWHFDLGNWQPYIGAQFGANYGDDVDCTMLAGPEGGVKYFVNTTTFIFASVEYQVYFDDQGEESSDAAWVYGLGIGFRF
jgi:hypothetical protein